MLKSEILPILLDASFSLVGGCFEMFIFQLLIERFGNRTDASGPSSVEACSVIVVILIRGHCQALSGLSHEYFTISDVCVFGINI